MILTKILRRLCSQHPIPKLLITRGPLRNTEKMRYSIFFPDFFPRMVLNLFQADIQSLKINFSVEILNKTTKKLHKHVKDIGPDERVKESTVLFLVTKLPEFFTFFFGLKKKLTFFLFSLRM